MQISIHALREEGDSIMWMMFAAMLISIHALREEGDLNAGGVGNAGGLISIHALREEGDSPTLPRRIVGRIFLSTPSARRATSSARRNASRSRISIHALREEGDVLSALSPQPLYNFYPRPPRGGRPGSAGGRP